jgi:uncharacterized protein (DUF169 family)
MTTLVEAANGIRDFLRLRTLPLAVKFIEDANDLTKIPKLRRPDHLVSWCQVVGISRNLGWTMGITIDDLTTPACAFKLGFGYFPTEYKPYYAGMWVKTQEDSVKYVDSIPCLPFGKFKAIAVAPIASERIESPDLAYIFGTPAQMNLLLNGLQYDGYERLHFYFSGEGSCADAFVEAYKNGKPQLTVPCLGERLMGLVQDDELEIAMPFNLLQKAFDGMMALRASRTIGYPIPYFGYQADIFPLINRTYKGIDKLMEMVKQQTKK